MKKIHSIRLTIIIPIIFSGIAVLASIGTIRVIEIYSRTTVPDNSGIYVWLVFIACFSFVCGLIVSRLIIRPVEKFIEKTEVVTSIKEEDLSVTGDPIERYSNFFDKITEALSKVESRELFPEIIGESKAIRGILKQVKKVSATDTTVLLLGESGTGKELIADSIHRNSNRKKGPLIKLNCVAIPEGLLESELFGHEKGSFTGATSRKIGKFELADGGTLFLDEIGDMPLSTQAKLLRVLQERCFQRVGGTSEIKSDVRFIVATNKNIENMVKEGTFREDLFFRINVFTIEIPPLRKRVEDIAVLAEYFARLMKRPVKITSWALKMLMTYNWPGNIRELKNTIERASVMSEQGVIDAENLPAVMNIAGDNISGQDDETLDDKIRKIEKGVIIEALRKTGGVQIKAAGILGISQRSLWHRVKKHNIDVQTFKE